MWHFDTFSFVVNMAAYTNVEFRWFKILDFEKSKCTNGFEYNLNYLMNYGKRMSLGRPSVTDRCVHFSFLNVILPIIN